MEWLGIGIMIAIGFYFAPVIIALVALVFTGIMVGIVSIFRFLLGNASH